MIGPAPRRSHLWLRRPFSLGGHRLPRRVLRAVVLLRLLAQWVAFFGRCLRPMVRWAGLVLGLAVFGLVIVSSYDRAVTVSGRSEVVAIQSDGSDFSNWTLPEASLTQEDTMGEAVKSALTIDLVSGATARFVRRGRGVLTVSFAAPHELGEADAPGCPKGARLVGRVTKGNADSVPLCDSARVALAVEPGEAPLVVSLRGGIIAGEEVRAGAGSQPVLLDGSAQLLVRHGPPFSHLCRIPLLHALCDRFVASRFDLSAGDTLGFTHAHHQAEATGFFRLDPEDLAGGLRFDVAAADAALEVRRMKGDAFELSESLFERWAKSPLFQALNAIVLALGLVWWFVRAPAAATGGHGGAGGHHSHVVAALALATSVLLTTPALADQALLRAGETGQALLRSRSDRCYAVTPRHVLGDETAVSLVLPGRVLADADLLRTIPAAPEEMALLLARAVPPNLCPAFAGAQPLDEVLRSRSGAVLRLVRQDGSFDRIPLVVVSVDVETFEVRPQDQASVLAQGMSGATVVVGDQPAGLLTDVRDDGRTGRIMRLDRVSERLEPYLGVNLLPPSTTKSRAGGKTDTVGMTVVSWTAEPVAVANRADNLLSDDGQPWRVKDPVATIVFRLGPERATLTGVLVDGGGLPDPPRSVEVLLGASERGPWRSVASFALEPGDKSRLLPIPPTRAGFALLRMAGFQFSEATMALTVAGFQTK